MNPMTIIKIIVTAGLVLGLLIFSGLESVLEAVVTMDPLLLVLSLSLTPPTMLFRFVRWNYMLNASHVHVPFSEIARIYCIGFFFGTITPSKIGNLVKFHYLKKHYQVQRSTALSLSLMDRIFDIMIVAGIALVGFVFLLAALPNTLLLGTFIILLFVLMILMFTERIFKMAARFVVARLHLFKSVFKKGEFDTNAITDHLYQPVKEIKRLRYLLPILFLSALIWFLVGWQTSLILDAMGSPVGITRALAFIAIGTLVGLLPITLSGLGIREGAFAFLLTTAGIPLNIGVVASLIAFLLGHLPPAVFGAAVYLLYRKKQPATTGDSSLFKGDAHLYT